MGYRIENCSCGRSHTASLDRIITGSGAINEIPEVLKSYGIKKPFILCDKNTRRAAGEAVEKILGENGYCYSVYTFPTERPEPDEYFIGSAFMHFESSCDCIIGVGSGVINDISKLISTVAGRKYIIVATAPSMDGYASVLSSVARDGLKISLPTRCADVIIGDTDILASAPAHMLKAGLGDMLAKYVSICEWRIANLITGEYYCEEIAQYIRDALKKCVDNAEVFLKGDKTAVEAVFEGLCASGIAMAYAGVSRPASGVEHYFSHVWDMRGLEFGIPIELHGIQCAFGTLLAVRLYEQLKEITPDREKALKHAESFDFAAWSSKMREFLGGGADTMIALEAKEGKYDREKHRARLEVILDNWDGILRIIDEELPSAEELTKLMELIELPMTSKELGIDEEILPMTFMTTKDIRDKYVLSRLGWDLGILEELKI